MHKKALRIWLSTLLFSVSSICSADRLDLPDIGDSSSTALNPTQEQMIGQAVLHQFRSHNLILEDPLIQEYVQSLGYRLVSNSDGQNQEFTFFVVRDSTVNAFAAPGGVVGINTGLILTSQSESELAAVLAHEITHVSQRHLARAYEASGKFSLATTAAIIAAILLSQSNPEVGQALYASSIAANAQLQINFTRANEKEADRIGIQVLANSGFDPKSMAVFFDRMQQANRYYGQQLPEFLSTHPVTDNRIAEAISRAEKYPPNNNRSSSRYHLARVRAQVLTADNPANSLDLFSKQLNSGQNINTESLQYGYSLALLADGQADQAAGQIKLLLKKNPDRIAYRILQAQIALAQGKISQMEQIFSDALAIYPYNTPLTIHFSEALIEAKNPHLAKKILGEFLVKNRTNPTSHKLYAQAAIDTGSPAEAHLHMAEYYSLRGQPEAALAQLTEASRIDLEDYYLSARIEAQLNSLKKELEDKKK